jgi:hypothetical protein
MSMTVRGSIHRDTHQHNALLTSAHAEASSSHLVMFNNYNWNGILKCPATGTWGRIFDSQFIGTSLCTRYLASDLGLGSQVHAGALDNQGGILLTDYNNAAIKKCTIDSSPSCESIITGINQPTGVAIDSSGTYFVVTGFTSIFRCVCASPPCSASTSCTEIGTGLFDQPGWIVMHPDGSLVVPDMSPKKIYKCPKDFSSTCTLVYDYDSHYTSWNIEAGPRQVTFDSNGDYIFAQRSWANGAIIKCPSTCEGCSTCTRVAHVVYHAQSVAIDPNGDYIVNEDSEISVRRIDPATGTATNLGESGFMGIAPLFILMLSADAGASAVGDPHLQNVHGERFDLMKPGKHVLINIPRGVSAEKSLLRVQADARQLGGQCADMYFQEVNVTGSWAEAKQAGGYHYSASYSGVEAPEWIDLQKVGLKVVHGRTDSGLAYLNVYVKHLGRAGFAVGGLLGEDDHEDVITPLAACAQRMSLAKSHKAPQGLSVAVASLA